MNSVPPLHPKPPGLGLRALSLVVPGIREVSSQIEPYTKWWSDQNQSALQQTDRPLLAVIGDSTAVGIGASAPDRGYVGLVRDALDLRDAGQADGWRVINLAQSGARSADGLDRQLPIIDDLQASPSAPSVVICSIGTNDVVWSKDTTSLRERLKELIARLPDCALVALVAGESPRARLANRTIRNAAGERGLPVVNPWGEPGPPPQQRLAADRFHPSDLGHLLMARPFTRQLNAPEPTAG
ncbi:MAG: SGNH/GDSL hydrolase family protein [Acidimicrobiales bacterium]